MTKKMLTIIAFLYLYGHAQNMDSLKLALKTAKHDTTRCDILNTIIEIENNDSIWPKYFHLLNAVVKRHNNKKFLGYYEASLSNVGNKYYEKNDFNKALFFFKKSFSISSFIANKQLMAKSLTNIGFIYDELGSQEKAIECYNKALTFQKEVVDEMGMISTLNNIASIYEDQAQISKALEIYHISLKISEKNNYKTAIANCLNNIAYIYEDQNNITTALKYYKKSLEIYQSVGDRKKTAIALNNIGHAYSSLGNILNARTNYNKSLAIAEELNDKRKIANYLNNVGHTYELEDNNKIARLYYEKSLDLKQQLNDKSGIVISTNKIAKLFIKEGLIEKAFPFAMRSMDLSKDLNFPQDIKNASGTLKLIYQSQNNYKKAFQMYQIEIQMRDSISNQETRNASVKKQLQYEYEKKESAVKADQDKKDIITLKEKQKQEIIIYTITGGFIIVLGLGLFVYRSYRQKQKANIIIIQQKLIVEQQKEEVEHQKHIIEEAQKEMSDSINYAKRIQSSFMASKEELDIHLNDYFILFKPKEVVSGDFYWANSSNNYFYLCTADSTGHGIPGAFMSLLNISLLNEAIFSRNLINTADILNFVRKILILGVKADESGQGGKDGMDCSLMRFNFASQQLTYSAANNPIWIVRQPVSSNHECDNGSNENQNKMLELIELKPDKMPVGKHDKQDVSFTQHQIQLQKGDVIYTLTDGFSDQFGGPKGKKFMSKKLRELLLANAHLPMREQKQLLENTFTNWVGNTEQIDDVTLIGIRV